MGPFETWEMTPKVDVGLAAVFAWGAHQWMAFPADGATLYQLSGGAALALLAFVIAPVATILTMGAGVRSQHFDKKFRPKLIEAMKWAFGICAVLLVVSVIVGASDPGEPGRWAWGRAVVVGTTLAAVSAVTRLFVQFLASLKVRQADADRPIRDLHR